MMKLFIAHPAKHTSVLIHLHLTPYLTISLIDNLKGFMILLSQNRGLNSPVTLLSEAARYFLVSPDGRAKG